MLMLTLSLKKFEDIKRYLKTFYLYMFLSLVVAHSLLLLANLVIELFNCQVLETIKVWEIKTQESNQVFGNQLWKW